MGTAIALGVVLVALAGLLVVLLRGIDVAELRARPMGIVSVEGLVVVVGLGFILGLGYGILFGSRGGGSVWLWVGRGLLDGLLMACAAAFYVGLMQRRQRDKLRPPDDDGA